MFPITPSTTEFISLDEVKAQTNVPASDTSHDTELDLFREAAQEQVEALVGPVLQRQVVETVRARPSGVVFLNQSPVVSVDTLTASGQPVTGYTLNNADGLLTGLVTAGDLVVTYTVGRTEAPASLRVAALIIAAHLWDTQRGNAPSAMPDDLTPVEFGLGYSLPNRALELLAPYMLAPAVA